MKLWWAFVLRPPTPESPHVNRDSVATATSPPVPESGAETRSRLRNRSLFKAAASSGLAKAASVALNAITIPIVVRALGVERYGLWTTITAISSLLVFADFGLSNGLVAVISEAHGRNDRPAAIRAVSSAFFSLLILAILLVVATLALAPLIPWASLLHITQTVAAPDVAPSVIVFLVLQFGILPALIAQKVQIGYQEMHLTNVCQIVGSVISALGVVFAARMGLALPWFVLLFSLGPFLTQLANSGIVFFVRRPWLRPKLSAFHGAAAKDLSRTGAMFLALQLAGVLGTSLDSIILTRSLGLASVAQYAIAVRVFAASGLVQFFLVPLWPAFGEALARGDHDWARAALIRCLRFATGISMLTSIVAALAMNPLIRFWVPEIQSVPSSLRWAFVVMAPLGAYGATMSSFLNNRRTLRLQLGFFSLASFAALCAKIVLVNMVGISGIIWGSALGYSIFYVVPAWRLAMRTLSDSRFKEKLPATA